MNKVDKLISELSPNGIEYISLKEVASINRGKRVTKNQLNNKYKIPVYSGGVTPMGYYTEYNQQANTTTVVKYGTAGFVNFIEESFWANDVCYCIKPLEKEILNKKFLFYYLKSKQNLLQSLKIDATPAHLPTDVIKNFEIPTPP